MNTQTIAKAVLTRRGLPATAKRYGAQSCTFQVVAQLHKLGGNAKAHFSVTGTLWSGTGAYNDRNDLAGGCMHKDVLRIFPKLAPIVALHLSDEDGQPMHAAGNGLYWLAGFATGNLAQEYHGGSGSSSKAPAECLRIAADHLRITVYEAEALAAHLSEVCEKAKASVATSAKVSTAAQKEQRKQARIALNAAMVAYCETQRERWQAEATAGLALIRELATQPAETVTA